MDFYTKTYTDLYRLIRTLIQHRISYNQIVYYEGIAMIAASQGAVKLFQTMEIVGKANNSYKC